MLSGLHSCYHLPNHQNRPTHKYCFALLGGGRLENHPISVHGCAAYMIPRSVSKRCWGKHCGGNPFLVAVAASTSATARHCSIEHFCSSVEGVDISTVFRIGFHAVLHSSIEFCGVHHYGSPHLSLQHIRRFIQYVVVGCGLGDMVVEESVV